MQHIQNSAKGSNIFFSRFFPLAVETYLLRIRAIWLLRGF